jgi:hypothetical protein
LSDDHHAHVPGHAHGDVVDVEGNLAHQKYFKLMRFWKWDGDINMKVYRHKFKTVLLIVRKHWDSSLNLIQIR